MSEHGPFVQVAAFCRDVVEQADRAVTLVGVTNKLSVEAGDDGVFNADIMMFVTIRAGDIRGKHEIHVQPRSPSGMKALRAARCLRYSKAGLRE